MLRERNLLEQKLLNRATGMGYFFVIGSFFLKGRFIFGGKGSQSSLILRVGFSRTQSRLKNKCTHLPNLKTQNTLLHMQLLHKRLHHFLIGAFRIGYIHKKKSKQNSNMCTDCAFGLQRQLSYNESAKQNRVRRH